MSKVSNYSARYSRTGHHGTGSHDPSLNPLNDNFDKIWPKGVPWWRFYPVAERICRKIEYAKKHWGCTIFYCDTNGIHRQIGEKQEFKWRLLESHVWRDIIRRHPDVLIIPEFAPSPAQYAYTSCYLQPPYSSAITRPDIGKLLPGAFSVSYTVNLSGTDWDSRRGQLLEGIKKGDSMFFRGWFGCGYNAKIKRMYDEVYEPGAINPGLPELPEPPAPSGAWSAGSSGAPRSGEETAPQKVQAPRQKTVEEEAERLYRVGRQAERMRQREAAARFYRKIVDDFPDTDATRKAAKRLKKLKR